VPRLERWDALIEILRPRPFASSGLSAERPSHNVGRSRTDHRCSVELREPRCSRDAAPDDHINLPTLLFSKMMSVILARANQ